MDRTPPAEAAPIRVRGDFNGLFGDILCLSHDAVAHAEDGTVLCAGMRVAAVEPDASPGESPVELVAEGTVEPAPDWLQCRGARWVLRIDARGVRRVYGTFSAT